MSRYTLQRKLGAGGMGDVWEATDASLGRRVAVKTIKPELAADPHMFARFRQEAEAAASLGHPNIIQVIELTNDNPPLLVMEMLDGQSLRDLLVAEGRLAPQRACFIALQILSALAAAHAARIVHRDIKPGNVYVVKTLAVADFVKVLDFGIAKLLDRTMPDGSSPLTALGDVLGTTAYMAPEQALGMPVDARADLFAVGAILFEALAGTRAREPGPGGKNDIRDVAFKPCRKLADVAPWVDHGLAAIVDRALSLDSNARFSSAEEMVQALSPFAQAAGSNPRLDVMATVRDAPPTVAAPPTYAQPQQQFHVPPPHATPRALLPAGKPMPWTMIAIPLGVLLAAGLGVGGIVLYLGIDGMNEQEAFVKKHPASTCVAPRECREVDSMGYSRIGGKQYGICALAPTMPRNAFADGDLVYFDSLGTPSLGVVVSAPDEFTYRVQSVFVDTPQQMPRTRLLGHACVANAK